MPKQYRIRTKKDPRTRIDLFEIQELDDTSGSGYWFPIARDCWEARAIKKMEVYKKWSER